MTDVPFPVASHFAQRVVDWATAALRSDHAAPPGKKRKRGGQGIPWTEEQRTTCWGALHSALASQHAVTAHPALWAAVQHQLTSMAQATTPGPPPSLPHITAVVEQLSTGALAAAAQPSPEQLGSVVCAAVDVLVQWGRPGRCLVQLLLPAATALLHGTVGGDGG